MGLPIAADMCSSQLELIYGSPIAADISLKLGTVWVKILIFLFFFLRATQLVHTRYYWISQIFVFGAVVYTPFWSKRPPLDPSNYRITSPKRCHFDHFIFIILGGGGNAHMGEIMRFHFFFSPPSMLSIHPILAFLKYSSLGLSFAPHPGQKDPPWTHQTAELRPPDGAHLDHFWAPIWAVFFFFYKMRNLLDGSEIFKRLPHAVYTRY